jgi:hypothetical protein
MSQFVKEEDERRRSPRFSCGGRAMIRCLSADGLVIPAKLRNLSLGGICVDVSHPFDPNERAEILVSVNAVSFRALGLVRAIQQRTRASMEFVRMSAGSKTLLEDLVEELAEYQAAMNKLRSARVEAEEELYCELERVRMCMDSASAALSASRRPLIAGAAAKGSVGKDRTAEASPLVIDVDLFG